MPTCHVLFVAVAPGEPVMSTQVSHICCTCGFNIRWHCSCISGMPRTFMKKVVCWDARNPHGQKWFGANMSMFRYQRIRKWTGSIGRSGGLLGPSWDIIGVFWGALWTSVQLLFGGLWMPSWYPLGHLFRGYCLSVVFPNAQALKHWFWNKQV